MFGFGFDALAIIALMGIGNFIFWAFILKKFIKDKHRRIILTWFATIALTPLMYLAFISVLIFSFSYVPDRDFDRKDWMSDRISRHEMADDLIDNKMLIGKDTNYLKQLLDEPRLRTDTTWSYDMGAGGGGLGFRFH